VFDSRTELSVLGELLRGLLEVGIHWGLFEVLLAQILHDVDGHRHDPNVVADERAACRKVQA
jgi:hypothetical protein